MAAYTQFGYGYPAASQLLAGNVGGVGSGNSGSIQTAHTTGGSSTTPSINQTTTVSAQSPLSGGANPPSLSPGGSATGVQSGGLSPGALSQTSQNAPPTSTSSCCENGRPIMTDPVSGQTVCSCQYDSARLALSGYSRIPTGGVGVYGTPYPSTEQNPYPSIGVDSSAFYSPLSNPYALKDSGPTGDMSAWTSAGLQPTTGYYPYDPTLAAYGYGAGYDLAARRKNATRESTATLKAWLNEHKKNPYPTKGEKIMLAIITKMTLTQVSTWFANARRRLKKENKMTWEPKNKTDDDDDAMVSDDEKDKDDLDLHIDKARDHKDSLHHVKSEHEKEDDDDDLTDDDRKPDAMLGQHHHHHPGLSNHLQQYHPAYSHHHHHPAMLSGYHSHSHQHHSNLIKEEMNLLANSKNQSSSDCGIPIPATKPKIWSLADTAACKTPPPTHHGQWMTGGGGGNGSGPGGGNYHPAHHNPTTHLQDGGMIGMMMGGGIGAPGSGTTTPTNHMNPTMMNTNPHHQHQSMTAGSGGMTVSTSPGAMMNSHHQFTNSPYARYGGFLTGPHHYQSQANIVTGPQHQNTPQIQGSTTPTLNQQHQTLTPSSNQTNPLANTNHNSNSNQSMGFPEVQTDTPPQTPPNMKLPSVAGNLITTQTNQITTHHNNTAVTSPNPMTGTCYNNNNNNSTTNNNNLNGGYTSASSSPVNGMQNSSFLSNFTTDSPQKLAQDYLMSSGNGHHIQNNHIQDGTTAFKPFYKSSQPITNGFVSPV